MTGKRTVEVFSAGCPVCDEAVKLVQSIACPACAVTVLDMNNASVAGRAQSLGIGAVPAVVVDGRLAECCRGRGVDEADLRSAGVGQPVA
jgi:hypothetical protein